jgi:hypothetical protein
VRAAEPRLADARVVAAYRVRFGSPSEAALGGVRGTSRVSSCAPASPRSQPHVRARPWPQFGAKVAARPLFEQDRATLLRLVQGLAPGDWERPTAVAPWLVRDVVAHLLGDDLSRLARTRDGHSPVGSRTSRWPPSSTASTTTGSRWRAG